MSDVQKIQVEPPNQLDQDNKAISGKSKMASRDEMKQLSPKEIIIAFSGLASAMFLASLDTTIVSPILPKIQSSLNASQSDYTWIIVSYLLASTASQPVYGKMCDIFGKKELLLFSIIIFLGGSLIAGLASSSSTLIAGRTIQGIGAGGIMGLIMITIATLVPLRERGKYQGIIGATFGISSIIGPLIGGWLTDNFGWQWAFFINLPVGSVSFIIVFLFLKVPKKNMKFKDQIKLIDFIGIILLISSVCSLVLGLSWGGELYPWSDSIIISLFIVCAILGFTFGAWEYTYLCCFMISLYKKIKIPYIEVLLNAEPIIDPSLFLVWNFNFATLASFFFGAVMYGAIYYLPLYFTKVDGSDATQSGLKLVPLMMGFVFCSIFSGAMISKHGHYIYFPRIGTALIVIGVALLSTLNTIPNTSAEIGYMIITGAGMGFTLQPVLMAMQAEMDTKRLAVSISSLTFFRTIGNVVGIAIFGSILTNVFSTDVTHDTIANAYKSYLIESKVPMSLGNAPKAPLSSGDWSNLPSWQYLFFQKAVVHGVQTVFQTCIGFGLIAFIFTLFLKQIELKPRANMNEVAKTESVIAH